MLTEAQKRICRLLDIAVNDEATVPVEMIDKLIELETRNPLKFARELFLLLKVGF